ncbi:MAG TPA: hypothetical protein VJR93_08950 [Chthoniobacterales bacterium]|nr:hypothetical protein [Chthoniobacterales bacterium]
MKVFLSLKSQVLAAEAKALSAVALVDVDRALQKNLENHVCFGAMIGRVLQSGKYEIYRGKIRRLFIHRPFEPAFMLSSRGLHIHFIRRAKFLDDLFLNNFVDVDTTAGIPRSIAVIIPITVTTAPVATFQVCRAGHRRPHLRRPRWHRH